MMVSYIFLFNILKKLLNCTVIFLLLGIFLAIVIYCKKLVNLRKLLHNIPGSPVNPVMSNFVPLKATMKTINCSLSFKIFNLLCGFTNVFGQEGIWWFWAGFKPVVILCRAETVEVLLSNPSLTKKSIEYTFSKPWLQNGLLTSSGKVWRSRRKLLNPAFNSKLLEEFLVIMDEQSTLLVKKLKKIHSEEYVDLFPILSDCALDIICETAMGVKLNAQKDEKTPYKEALHIHHSSVCKSVVIRCLSPWLWPDFIYYSSSPGKRFQQALDRVNAFNLKVINERKKSFLKEMTGKSNLNHKERRALMDLLLIHYMKDNSITKDDIQDEVNTFMFTGHDTTSHGTMWTLYLLGLHPDIQEKVIEEIDNIFKFGSQRPITVNDLKSMNYLECCIKEAHRIYPPSPLVARELVEDIEINGCIIPKGITCAVFIYMLHRDPSAFPNPEAFNPDRFLPENIAGRHTFTYLPFSAGIRNCIGQRFAMMEEKVVLANIFRNFIVTSVDTRDKIRLIPEVVLRSKYGLRMKLKERKNGCL